MGFTAKGTIPIEKNIIVVDVNGNEYEATYPKRAKGLVKSGRARFIAENRICMLCPPNIELEDDDMSENKKTVINNDKSNSGANDLPKELTMSYLLGKLEEITLEQSFLTKAISELGKMKSAGPGDVGTQEQAKAVGEIIKAREATNQRLITLYEKMYNDLASKKDAYSLKEMAFRALEKAADDEGKLAAVSDMLDTIRHLA